jgi:hypothetical protein
MPFLPVKISDYKKKTITFQKSYTSLFALCAAFAEAFTPMALMATFAFIVVFALVDDCMCVSSPSLV